MLPRLKPRCFYDLVIEIAIVRPGPIQGGMVHPYLRRRQGLEAIDYPNPEIQAVLERTLGIPVFQEQVIRLAMVAAGFSGGEADQLRRAMASWGKDSQLSGFEDKLIEGMLSRGYSMDFAQRLYQQIQGFGVYGFPESHSASFALLAYVSAWLKCHYPAAFYCALLNSQPMGFYSPSQVLQDARRHGIKVAPIDVNQSDWQHTLESRNAHEEPTLRLGFRLIKGLPQTTAGQIVSARHGPANGQPRPFSSVEDIARRGSISTTNMTLLGSAGALDGLTSHRRQAHWQILATEDRRPLLDAAPTDPANKSHSHCPTPTRPRSTDPEETRFTPLDEIQRLRADYSSTGVTLGRHPMQILRERFPRFERCKRHADLAVLGHRRFVRIAGIVTGRQRPGTASGVIFLTLEDETGNSNIVVWKSVQQRCRQALLKAQLLMVKGVIETEGSVVHVIAQQLTDCSELLYDTEIRSRDFH